MRYQLLFAAILVMGIGGCSRSHSTGLPPEASLQPRFSDPLRVPTLEDSPLVRDGLVRDGLVRDGLVRDGLVADQPLPVTDPLVERVVPSTAPLDPYTLEYNPNSVVTLRGPITGFRRIALADEQTGLLARVQATGGQTWVYLGPEAWLLQRLEPLSITQNISVTGSMSGGSRQPVLIAPQVGWRDLRVTLRDEAGTPYWTFPSESVSARLDRERDVAARRETYLQERLARVQREEAVLQQRLRDERVK